MTSVNGFGRSSNDAFLGDQEKKALQRRSLTPAQKYRKRVYDKERYRKRKQLALATSTLTKSSGKLSGIGENCSVDHCVKASEKMHMSNENMTEKRKLEKGTTVRVKELVEAKCRLKEMKEQAAVNVKELNDQLVIEKLKEEIGVLEEIVMDLEYLSEMYSKSDSAPSLS